MCEKHGITFTAKPEKFPKNRLEEMIPCFGRHSTIRTNYEVDDYLRKFYLSYFPKKKTYYVFKAEQHGTPEVRFTFYEQILDNSWQRFASTVDDYIDASELLREQVLNTVEMYNYWPHEIENIFVNEMISNKTPKR